ncbi:hypothetical protein Btru_058027 [Bulinus truncatus]|nr:hypothetical protein Btru_058027 [Bulinus truncatus]
MKSVSRSGYNINIAIRQLEILRDNIVNDAVDSSVAIDSFQKWLVQRNAHETFQYDFALHWTGFNLQSSKSNETHYDSVCAGQTAASVVEFQETYKDVVGTARAISLLLGSSMDGLTSNYVSAFSNSPNHTNRWSFSPCSPSSMKEYLQQLRPNCLLTSNPMTIKPG